MKRTKRLELLLTPEEDQAVTDYAVREDITRGETVRRGLRAILHIAAPRKRATPAQEEQPK